MVLFGNRLRYLRKRSNLTQERLGKVLNVSTSTIGMYERGSREPGYKLLVEIANYFNVSIDYLLGNSDSPIIKEKQEPYPTLSKHDEQILHLQQEFPELFQGIRNAKRSELVKMTQIMKILQGN